MYYNFSSRRYENAIQFLGRVEYGAAVTILLRTCAKLLHVSVPAMHGFFAKLQDLTFSITKSNLSVYAIAIEWIGLQQVPTCKS